ncbi:WecB/TagA/CpsF family glycosyltransferase [Waterburya agarophytonicola K14]|uniref:WecB/TagA/CpsF family glycosyltransferase n=1 Tax=Waterburya agarophytonicola KI4 TaxID=2874699 RepID=A0A964FHY8_9CYAN|nr:WecB/TagA/CpsF family glycosyltransferase [Waterburya agarophytonicola]MCC0178004.1 WecB/TagA/CpsF family glycosyltransferase [Waterburya agarophytonicola KI4]
MLTKESNLPAPPTFPILNLHVHLLENYQDWLLARLKQGIGTHVVTLNAEMTMMAEENPVLSQAIKEAELIIPDGAGIIIYMRLRGVKHQRCPGIELAESLIAKTGQANSDNCLVFFGGTPETAANALQTWQEKFPSLNILSQDGYISGDRETEWKKTLQEKQPQIIFVGIGVPRQELWIRENRHLCPNAVWVGVGGSFDIWAGNKSRAPQWLRNNNLEWSYRLYQEPWRWRRMLSLPKFFWRSLVSLKAKR